MSDVVEWFAGINAVLGAWLVAVPFVFADPVEPGVGFAFWNYALLGATVMLLSGYNWWVAEEDHPGSEAAATASAVLGLWLAVVPFVTGTGAGGLLLLNDVLVGAVIAILGGYNAWRAWSGGAEAGTAPT